MKKKISLVFCVLLVMLSLVACGNKEDSDQVKVALLCDPAGTQVFTLNMIEGLKDAAEKYDFEAIVAECADAAAYEDNARGLVQEGVDLIIGGGWQSGEAIKTVAEEFPDEASYALIDSEIDQDNVKCISYREQEGAYLIGQIAALVTDEKDNKFGSIHVNEGYGSWKWRYGLMEGTKSIKPDSEFIFNYVGDFNDPAKAKEFAIQQYEQGCQFVNAAAAGGDKGVFEAAKDKKFYSSGQDIDLTSPENPYIVTSQIKDTYTTVTYLLDRYFGDDWNLEDETWGLQEGTVGAVHVTHESENEIIDRLTEEDIEILKQTAEDIKSGKLDLKNVPEEESYK